MSRYDTSKLFKNYPDDAVDTVNALMTPAFQNSLLNLFSSVSDITDSITDSFAPALNSFAKYVEDNFDLELFLQSASCTSGAVASIFNEILNNYSSVFSEIEKISDDDFDESVVKELEVPDTVFIPFGNKKVKIKSELLVSILIAVIFNLLMQIQSIYSSDSALISQEKYHDAQLQLTRERNKIEYDLLRSFDTSISSQTEAIEDLKESLQALDSYLQDVNSSPDSVPEKTDNNP